MGFKEKLYEQIKALGYKGYTEAQLENKLNFRTRLERKVFRSALKELINDGSVIDKGKGRLTARTYTSLLKGELKGNRRGFAFLIREDKGEDIFIPNRSLSGALHGDTVLVRQNDENEGEVVKIEKRGINKLVGTYIISGKLGFVRPDDDCYFKDIFVPKEKSNKAKPSYKVVVSIKIDPKNHKPFGEILEVLGTAGEKDAEVLSILRNYGFFERFPDKVLEAAQGIRYKEENGRKDFRDLLTITIDGEDAKDFDDAISVFKADYGYELYVHIADVANYVRQGSVIDREALLRATSVYFPGSVFPMLPEEISNGVCSLRPDEDKFTLSVAIRLNDKGAVISYEFYESIIRSNYRMTYSNVTKILSGDKELSERYKDILPMLIVAKELSDKLEMIAKERGAINFVSRETKVELDDKGEVINISPYPYDSSNLIIEHFMILANECTAELTSRKLLPSIYRVHEAPNEDKLTSLKGFLDGLGLSLNTEQGAKPKAFSELLMRIKDEPSEGIINKIMLRSMMKARYSTINSGHFGLSLDNYCHFTSPIRRYPDLMVHRALKAYLKKQASEEFRVKQKELAENAASISTDREIAAERAERDIDDYYKAVYMSKNIGKTYDGIISGVAASGIFVTLDNTAEGYVPVMELPEDRYELDERNYRLMGIKYMFSLADKVKVEIKSVQMETRSINMTLVSEIKNHLRKTIKGAKIKA